MILHCCLPSINHNVICNVQYSTVTLIYQKFHYLSGYII